MEKKCSKCEIEKSITEFHKQKGRKDGYRSHCKQCIKKETQIFYVENKPSILKKKLDYYVDNKNDIKEKRKDYKKNNLDKVKDIYCNSYSKNCEKYKKKGKIYRENNKTKISDYQKKYNVDNCILIKEKAKNYRVNNREKINDHEKQRKLNDPLFKLTKKLRSSIGDYLKRNGFSKKSRTHEILGCSFEEFKQYLESKFESWMNWDNHGLYNGELDYGWDIDHRIPISSAKTEEDVIRLSHFSNLQPLCSKVNRYIKRDLF